MLLLLLLLPLPQLPPLPLLLWLLPLLLRQSGPLQREGERGRGRFQPRFQSLPQL